MVEEDVNWDLKLVLCEGEEVFWCEKWECFGEICDWEDEENGKGLMDREGCCDDGEVGGWGVNGVVEGECFWEEEGFKEEK